MMQARCDSCGAQEGDPHHSSCPYAGRPVAFYPQEQIWPLEPPPDYPVTIESRLGWMQRVTDVAPTRRFWVNYYAALILVLVLVWFVTK